MSPSLQWLVRSSYIDLDLLSCRTPSPWISLTSFSPLFLLSCHPLSGADATLLAARVEAVAREVQFSPEVQSSPHFKEWTGRIMRMCGAVAAYKPAEAIRAAERERGGAAFDDDDSDQEANDKRNPRGGLGRGRGGQAYGGSDDDSDDGRGGGGGVGTLAPMDQIMLPPAYLRRPNPNAAQAPRAGGGPGFGFNNPKGVQPSPSLLHRRQMSLGGAVGGDGGGGGGGGEGGEEEEGAFNGTVQTVVPAPGYLSHSTTG